MGGIYVDFSVVNQLNSPALNSNTFANRPSAGQAGRLFISTDTFEIYRDNGATWDLIGGPGTSTITGTGTPGTLPIFTAAQAIGDSSLIEGSTKFTTTKDFQSDAIYLNSMTLGSGALYYSGNRLTLANYNAGGDVMIEANGGAFAQFISGTDLSTTFYGNIIRNGGLSTQFLKADGSLDSNTYLTSNIYTADGSLAAARTVNLNNHNLRFEGGANTARVRISANNNVARIFSFATADSARWALRVDGNETGSNAGANFELRRYNDAGSYVSSPIIVNRASGNVGIGGGLQQLETFNVTGSSLFSHSYTQGNDFNRKGVFAFLNTTTNAGAGFTNGYNYNALSGLHWDNFSASTTIPNGVTIGGTYSGAQVGFDTINTTVTLAQGSGGGLRTFSGVISQIGIAAPTTGGVVTHASGFQALAPYYIGANLPTITNYFGVAINDSTEYSSVAITNRWGIYQNGATDRNYFNGNTLIGSNVDNGNKLQVTGQATISGNVGIGVTPSAWGGNARVLQGANGSAFTTNVAAPETSIISNAFYNGSAWIYSTSDEAARYSVNGYNGSHTWETAPSGTAGNAITFTQAMTLDASGRLGIGTQTPDFPIDVVRTSTGTVATFGIEGQTINPRLRIDADEANNTVTLNPNYNGSTSPALVFKTQEAERMRITSGGNVLLASTATLGINTPDGSDNGYLAIAGASADGENRAAHIYLSGNERSVDAGSLVLAAGNTSSGTGTPGTILFRTGAGSERMRITSGGNVLIGTTTDAGQKLQVNGTSYLNGNVGISATTNLNHPLNVQSNSSANAIALFGRSSDNTSSIDFFQNNGTTRLMEFGVSPSAAEFYYDANSPIKFYTNAIERMQIKSNGQVRFVPLAADPAGAQAGDVYYNSGTNKLRLYDGTNWVDLN